MYFRTPLHQQTFPGTGCHSHNVWPRSPPSPYHRRRSFFRAEVTMWCQFPRLDIGGEMWKVAIHHRMGTKSTFKVSEIISKLKMSSSHPNMSSIKVRIVYAALKTDVVPQRWWRWRLVSVFKVANFWFHVWFSGVWCCVIDSTLKLTMSYGILSRILEIVYIDVV